jgi:hypothetical protein
MHLWQINQLLAGVPDVGIEKKINLFVVCNCVIYVFWTPVIF